MAVSKILLDFSEYQRLKLFEKKYLDNKAEMKAITHPVQSGSGAHYNQSLEKTVIQNENKNENSEEVEPQQLLDPISVPQEREDIDREPGGREESSEQEPEPEPEQETETEPKKKSQKKLRSEDCWWYLGEPHHS